MKIDLITLHNVKNYGSALQTYATQTIFQNMGLDVEVINYYRKDLIDENIVENRINTSSVFSKNTFTKFLGKIFLEPSVKIQCEKFNDFLTKRINLTEKKYYSNEELKENMPEADIYCTGSDQVWNSDWNNGIEKPFFLDFVSDDKKKISYASSFGKEALDDTEIEITKEMLKKYKNISVREKSAKKIIEETLGIKDVEHVLDPTLLLNRYEWEKLKTDIKHKGKYILVYQLNSKNPEFDKYVKELSKYKKIPLIRISNVSYQKFKYGKFVYCPTVEEFISYFMNAEYIVTDSFHATAYSINFNKKFLCIFPKKFSTRLQSILDLTNLQNRKVINFNRFDNVDEKINWDNVNRVIEQERKKSMLYLKKAIEE